MRVAADARFQNTGLERSEPLQQDIKWMQEKYSLPAPQIKEDGPGQTYAKYVLAPPDKFLQLHELQLPVLSMLHPFTVLLSRLLFAMPPAIGWELLGRPAPPYPDVTS